MCEEWRDVVDFEGKYQISNLGNFRRHPDAQNKNKYVVPKPLERKTHINRLGYPYATLSLNNKNSKKTIHQMVAAAFIDGFVYGLEINHKNGIKTDNRVSNLEITTSQDNNLHAHKIGLMPKPGKSIYHNVHIRKSYYKDSVYITYMAMVKINGKSVYIGQSKVEVEAAKMVDSYLDSIGDIQRNRNFPNLTCPTTIP